MSERAGIDTRAARASQPSPSEERPDVKKRSAYASVKHQFDKAADRIQLDSDIRKILATTTNEIVVHFPVKMDDGRVEMFSGPSRAESASTRQSTSTRCGRWRPG
jgi:hypothetical protein